MRAPSIAALLVCAACAGERSRPSDTSPADTSSAPPAVDSPSTAAPDTQPPAASKSGTKQSTTTRSRESTRTTIDTNAPLHPSDTFGVRRRDTTLDAFLKKRPPEIRRPQYPQTTPR